MSDLRGNNNYIGPNSSLLHSLVWTFSKWCKVGVNMVPNENNLHTDSSGADRIATPLGLGTVMLMKCQL